MVEGLLRFNVRLIIPQCKFISLQKENCTFVCIAMIFICVLHVIIKTQLPYEISIKTKMYRFTLNDHFSPDIQSETLSREHAIYKLCRGPFSLSKYLHSFYQVPVYVKKILGTRSAGDLYIVIRLSVCPFALCPFKITCLRHILSPLYSIWPIFH